MRTVPLRAEFPVLERVAYLNAGTDGPVPARAVEAAVAELERQSADGRARPHLDRRRELEDTLRAAYAQRLGCPPADVALTTSTTEGIALALAGLGLGPGDEVLTSDQEHPGLLGPLKVVRDQRGVVVRQAPLADLADAVGPSTRLVACSHVSWVTGALAPSTLAELQVPVLLDGAQGVGALPVDLPGLGCSIYAASGQKWLCGPDGSGMLYVSPEMRERLAPTFPGFASLVDPAAGLDATLHADARRYDTPALPTEGTAFALASLEVLGRDGWDAVHSRAVGLAADLADRLREAGHEVTERADTTLVAWRCDESEAARDRLAAAGVVVRAIPGRDLLRASVGAWNDESDLERLLEGLGRRTRP